MRQFQDEIGMATRGQGLYEITGEAQDFVARSGIALGQLTLLCSTRSLLHVIGEELRRPKKRVPPRAQ